MPTADQYVRIVARELWSVLVLGVTAASSAVGFAASRVIEWPSWVWVLILVPAVLVAQWRAWVSMRAERNGLHDHLARVLTGPERKVVAVLMPEVPGKHRRMDIVNETMEPVTRIDYEIRALEDGDRVPELAEQYRTVSHLEPNEDWTVYADEHDQTARRFVVELEWNDLAGKRRTNRCVLDSAR